MSLIVQIPLLLVTTVIFERKKEKKDPGTLKKNKIKYLGSIVQRVSFPGAILLGTNIPGAIFQEAIVWEKFSYCHFKYKKGLH